LRSTGDHPGRISERGTTMRALLFFLAVLAMHPRAVAAQSSTSGVGARVQILPPAHVHLERAPGFARLTVTHPSHPHLAVVRRPGEPGCSIVPTIRAAGEVAADLRCTPAGPSPRIVRLLIVPAA
jgi:hypothetical protein